MESTIMTVYEYTFTTVLKEQPAIVRIYRANNDLQAFQQYCNSIVIQSLNMEDVVMVKITHKKV